MLKRVVIETKAEARSLMIKLQEDKKCFKCGNEGHPASHYPEVNNKDGTKNNIKISNV